MNITNKVRGEYSLVAMRDGQVVRESGWVPNMVLDNGLNLLMSGTTMMLYCSVGNGTVAPSATQTALAGYLRTAMRNSDVTGVIDAADSYAVKQTYTYAFDTATVNESYTEIGIGQGNAGNNLFSRALIVDGGGLPTSFTILAGEQLVVQYRLWIYQQITDAVTNITDGGTTYTFTTRAMEAASGNLLSTALDNGLYVNNMGTDYLRVNNGSIGDYLGSTTGWSAQAQANYIQVAAYNPGTYYRDSYVTFSISQANLAGGISAFYYTVGRLIKMQVGVSPSIPKTDTKTLTLTVRISVARA